MRPLFLIGFMGAGKSSVGRVVAARLGIPFVDLDEEIVRETGRTVDDLFAHGGEPCFRGAERAALAQLADRDDAVIACGGGAVTDEENRAVLRECGDVAYLVVSPEAALARVGSETTGRPLLRGEQLTSAAALLASRERLYETSADVRIETVGRNVEQVAEAVVTWVREHRVAPATQATEAEPAVGGTASRAPRRLTVDVPGRRYDVLIGRGLLDALGAKLAARTEARRCALVTDTVVGPLLAARAEASLCEAGFDPVTLSVPAGETSKSWRQAGDLLERMSEAGLGRDSLVIALGGGVVGDLAGFVASAYLRGVAVVQVPTTLLAQVDSSIGGKTGVDLPHGKNLAGAFWQPLLVVTDPDVLGTLPEVEWRSGLAEVAKSALLAGEETVGALEAEAAALLRREPKAVDAAVTMAAGLKARVVSGDEREAAGREALNYGHTFAHALERESGYGVVPHGAAVADGIRFAARLAERIGAASGDWARRQEHLLDALGLAPSGRACSPERLLDAMHADKKARAGRVRFVICSAPGKWSAVPIDDEVIARELAAWCERWSGGDQV